MKNLQDMKDKHKPKVQAARPTTKAVFTPELSKSHLSKKITKTANDEIIEQRKHKLKQKLEAAAKLKEKSAEEKVDEEVKPKKIHFTKKNLKKTRSKLKNKRKDNRPAEVLAKKFGSILNVE